MSYEVIIIFDWIYIKFGKKLVAFTPSSMNDIKLLSYMKPFLPPDSKTTIFTIFFTLQSTDCFSCN